MADMFRIVKGIGRLKYKNIYGFYDEPLVFSCSSLTGSLYFLLRLPSDYEQWCAVEVSEERLKLLENNLMEIREPFVHPENEYLYRLYSDHLNVEFEILTSDQLTEDMLPYSDEYLDYESEERGREQLGYIAKREKCTVLEMSFEKKDSHEMDISCVALSDALNNVQMLVYSLAYREGKPYGQFPKSIRDLHELKVTETFAASFGIQLKSEHLNEVEQQKKADDVLSRLDNLISSSQEAATLKQALISESNRTAIYFNRLLKGLKRNNLGFRFIAASPLKSYESKHLSTHQVNEVLQRITDEIREFKREEIYEGELKGIDVEKNQFTFISFEAAEEEIINGKISSELANRVFTVPSKTRIKVETSISFDRISGDEKYIFILLDVLNQ